MASTPPRGHKPAWRRAAVAVLIAAAAIVTLGTAAIPAVAARATHISRGIYLDFVIGRSWTEAAYQHWLAITLSAALLPPLRCRSQGPPGAKPEPQPQPQPNPAPGRATAAHQGPEVKRTNRAATFTPSDAEACKPGCRPLRSCFSWAPFEIHGARRAPGVRLPASVYPDVRWILRISAPLSSPADGCGGRG